MIFIDSLSGGIAIAQPPANFCYPSGIKTNFAGGEIKAKDGNRTGGEVGRSSASAVFLFLLLFYCSTALYAPALAEPGAFREIPPTPLAHLLFPLCSRRSLRLPLLRLSRLPKPHSEPKEDPRNRPHNWTLWRDLFRLGLEDRQQSAQPQSCGVPAGKFPTFSQVLQLSPIDQACP